MAVKAYQGPTALQTRLLLAAVGFLGVVGFALALPLAAPVWFREDDAGYLAWALGAGLGDCFDAGRGQLFGMFRPLVNLWWIGLVRAAGFEAYWYHAALCALYAGTVWAFWYAAEGLIGRGLGWVAVVCWGVAFLYLQHVLFWFSGYVYLLETLFLCLAVGFAARAFGQGGAGRWGALLAHTLAVLAKEPAALILPAVYAGLVWRWRPDARQALRLWPLAVAAVFGVAWVVLKPGLAGRLGFADALRDGVAIEFLTERWSFYAGFLAGGLGKLIWLGMGLGLARAVRSDGHLALVAGGAAVVAAAGVAWANPAAGLVLLAAMSAAWAWRERRAAAPLAWFWAPLAAVLLVDFQTRTYLLEGSFGLAAALALALTGLPGAAVHWVLRARWRWAVAAVVAVAVSGLAIGVLAPRVEALRTVVAVRGNFAALVREIVESGRDSRALAVPDYDDTGLDYTADVLRASEGRKAELQKPMRPRELDLLLQAMGAGVTRFDPAHPGTGPVLLLLMTGHEVDWWRRTAEERGIGWVEHRGFAKGSQRAQLVRVDDAAVLANILGGGR